MDAARLLADHSLNIALDGQTQTIETLLQAFLPGAITDGPDLPLARATAYLARGRLDQAAAHLTVAETLIRSTSSGRAVALMNLGVIEAWSPENQDSQRHLQEGADLARKIGRPYLEVACLAQLAFT